MLIKIDFQSETPIYLQLYQEIIKGLAIKKLQPGDPLPSVRVLSQDLGINMHTVNKTYSLLKQDGFIQIHRQKGVEINPDNMPIVDEEFIIRLQETLEPLITEGIVRGLNKEDFLKECIVLYDHFQKESEKIWTQKSCI